PDKPDGRVQTEEEARTSVVSMRDAINLSQNSDYKKREDLSDKQKKLVDTVAQERKTEEGRRLTDEAASRGEWITSDNNIQWGGTYNADLHLTSVQLENDHEKWDYTHSDQSLQAVLHHEELHSHQHASIQMPKGLSSYDQKLWSLGREGQAY